MRTNKGPAKLYWPAKHKGFDKFNKALVLHPKKSLTFGFFVLASDYLSMNKSSYSLG